MAITQAINEVNATEVKHVGQVIKWVMADIAKEEQPAIEDLPLDFKQTNGAIVRIIKEYYFDSIKGY